MRLFSILKRNSKLALRGSWGRAIIILLIMTGVSSLITALSQIAVGMFTEGSIYGNAASGHFGTFAEIVDEMRFSVPEWIIFGVSAVFSLLLSAPLSLGAARWHYSLVHGNGLPVTEAFYYFETGKSYARAVLYEINIGIRSLLWSVLFYLTPAAILGIALYFLSSGAELSRTGMMTATFGVFISIALFILATVFYAACVCRYALTPYLMADDANLTVGKAIKLSVRYTKGFRFSILGFGLSFIGWALLTVFFFPILYAAPYYSTAMAMYSRFIIEKNRSLIPGATREFSADTGELGMLGTQVEEKEEPEA